MKTSSFGTKQNEKKFTYRAGANYVTSSGIAPYISYATSFEPRARHRTSITNEAVQADLGQADGKAA